MIYKMNSIYNLYFDYIKENDNYLIISKDDQLTGSNLSEIHIKMIESNPIPNILSLEIEETDLKIRLRDKISYKKILPAYLKANPITVNKYYQLLFRVVSIIEDSKIFMLNEQNYILDKDFIFVGNGLNDIYLTYLPLKEIDGKSNLQGELKKLSFDLIGYVKDKTNNSINELVDFVKEEDFTVAELKNKIISLMDKDGINIISNQNISAADKPQDIKTDQKSDSPSIQETTQKPLTKQQKNIIYILTAFIIALIWRGYLDFQREGFIYIAVGLSLLAIDIAIILANIRRPSFKKKTKIKQKDIRHKSPGKKVNHDKRLNRFTTVLTKAEETVSLKESINNAQDNINMQTKTLLEVVRGSTTEKIELNKKSFIIGRNPAAVDYVENSRGVSRVHIEFFLTETGYAVRDLSSKNGSFLNQKELIPNKFYPIKNGDVIKIAKINFIFKFGL